MAETDKEAGPGAAADTKGETDVADKGIDTVTGLGTGRYRRLGYADPKS